MALEIKIKTCFSGWVNDYGSYSRQYNTDSLQFICQFLFGTVSSWILFFVNLKLHFKEKEVGKTSILGFSIFYMIYVLN